MIGKMLQGDTAGVQGQINELVTGLEQYFKVLRVKVEAAMSNQGLPEIDDVANTLPASCYYEYHVKLKLEKGCDLEALRALFKPFDGYVSRNAIKNDEQNSQMEYRFVTQRFHLGREVAEKKLAALLDFISSQDIEIIKVIKEFNIFDSNRDLDFGWTV
jgi:hypothetical protein